MSETTSAPLPGAPLPQVEVKKVAVPEAPQNTKQTTDWTGIFGAVSNGLSFGSSEKPGKPVFDLNAMFKGSEKDNQGQKLLIQLLGVLVVTAVVVVLFKMFKR